MKKRKKYIQELANYWYPMISTLGEELMERAVIKAREQHKLVGHSNYEEIAKQLANENINSN